MPPRKKAATGPTPFEDLRHEDTRANIPTGELAGFVADEQAVPPVRYARDPSFVRTREATARLEVRLQPDSKTRLERAAELARVPVSDFVRSAAEERAEQVLREHAAQTTVPAGSFDDLLAALDAPAQANDALPATIWPPSIWPPSTRASRISTAGCASTHPELTPAEWPARSSGSSRTSTRTTWSATTA